MVKSVGRHVTNLGDFPGNSTTRSNRAIGFYVNEPKVESKSLDQVSWGDWNFANQSQTKGQFMDKEMEIKGQVASTYPIHRHGHEEIAWYV